MTTIVGIKTKEGVVLGSDRRASKGFFIGSKITQKIAKIDDTVAVAIAGQLSDAEYMIKVAKAERRLMELRRGFPLTVKVYPVTPNRPELVLKSTETFTQYLREVYSYPIHFVLLCLRSQAFQTVLIFACTYLALES